MRWSQEKIWAWYNARPWMRGCNYISYDCANRIDQWQALGSEKRFEIVEDELKLMRETGFNTVRLILEYVVWKEEHDFYRGSHRPYDPQEIAIIKDFCALADRDFAKKNQQA